MPLDQLLECDAAPKVVIVVDDDPAVLNALKFSLEVDGYVVSAFESGQALLLEFDLLQAGCLVLDYKMPGLNGLELLEQLRSRGVTLPAILITTPTAQVRERAALAKVPIVEKPLLSSALVEQVGAFLQALPPTKRHAAADSSPRDLGDNARRT